MWSAPLQSNRALPSPNKMPLRWRRSAAGWTASRWRSSWRRCGCACLVPEQIADRLDNRFRLLTGGSRAALPRQQTLQALIDWSYDLLSQEEQGLFRRLAVFSGGWALEAAEAICSGFDVLELMADLVNKSLVSTQEAHDKSIRYSLLETMRQYGQERLLEAGETTEARDRHLGFFLAYVEAGEADYFGPARNIPFQCPGDRDQIISGLRCSGAWSEIQKLHCVLPAPWPNSGSVAAILPRHISG